MFNWKTFAAGALTATIGGSVVRPMLVSLVKTGIGLQTIAAEALEQAREETTKIQAEAASLRVAKAQASTEQDSLQSEIQQLRAEIDSLKSNLPKSNPE